MIPLNPHAINTIKFIRSENEEDEKDVSGEEMDPNTLYGLGIALMLVGVLVIVIAVFLLFFSSFKGEAKTQGGGAIIIGPFPIVFGTDKHSIRTILLLSIALTILLIVAMIVIYLLYG